MTKQLQGHSWFMITLQNSVYRSLCFESYWLLLRYNCAKLYKWKTVEKHILILHDHLKIDSRVIHDWQGLELMRCKSCCYLRLMVRSVMTDLNWFAVVSQWWGRWLPLVISHRWASSGPSLSGSVPTILQEPGRDTRRHLSQECSRV